VFTNKSHRKRAARDAQRAAAAGKNKKPPKPGSGFDAVEGELNRNAASVCMAALYAGRLARFDLLRAIQRLAEKFHKWTKRHSQKLHRLIEYINSHLHHKQYGFIGDPWEVLELVEFVDADWASDNQDKKSTTGALLALLGPNSFYPIGAICKKQGCQSLSTPEAEIVALTVSLKDLVYPMLDLVEHVLQRKKVVPAVFEDNEATQKIVKTGKVEKAWAILVVPMRSKFLGRPTSLKLAITRYVTAILRPWPLMCLPSISLIRSLGVTL
jgi:hypothetical protein